MSRATTLGSRPPAGRAGLVLWRQEPLSQAQLRTVERAAVMVALVLLAGERVAAAEHRAVQDLVTALLTSPQRDLPRLQREAERYGLRTGRQMSVIALHTVNASPQALRVARGELDANGITGVIEDDIVIITPDADAERIADRLRAALTRTTGEGVTGAVSRGLGARRPTGRVPPCLPLLAVARRARPDRCRDDRRRARPRTRSLFGEHDATDVERFLAATLQPLAEWDRTRSADLMETLLTYLECGSNTAAASRALHIHPNTLRQRLGRITALIPDWQQPSRALEIHLALKLSALRAAL